jgi:hypothetical protein
MDRVQRNGGTAGIITAICLALLFVLFISSGLDPQTAQDPAKAIPLLTQKASVFAAIGVLGTLAAGFGLVFTIGLFARLRDGAPTRAAAVLGLAFVGLTGHAVGSVLLWQGGQFLVTVSTKDQVGANHAWIAASAVAQGLNGAGNAFTGASILVAGGAVVATGAMNVGLGWMGGLAGVVEILQLFSASQALMGIGFVLVIIWLAWGGSQLRRSAA